MVDPWRLVSHELEPRFSERDETLFALADGTLGVRGGIEERASPTQASFLAGVWERLPIHYHERYRGFARGTDTRLPVADATAIRVRLGAVDPALGVPQSFERTLDLRHGSLRRRTVWTAHGTGSIEIHAERFVSGSHPALLCLRFEVRSIDYAGPLTLTSSVLADRLATSVEEDPRIGVAGSHRLQLVGAGADGGGAHVVQATVHSAITSAVVQRHRVEGAEAGGASHDARGAHQVFVAQIASGQSVVLEKFAAYAASSAGEPVDAPALVARADARAAAAAAAGYRAMGEAHASDFAAFWRDAELEIDGDAPVEQALRFNLFHLIQSAGRDGRAGIAAKGLTGEGYEGHVFWDAETYVLPVLCLTAPALARSHLHYRFLTLDRARAHARELNHARGALYAWRTIAGDECSAHYPSGSAQYHINAAVAFAIRSYVDATGDAVFLRDFGLEMLAETARIWLQVGHFNAHRGGAFCIDEVTGPDEYTTLVDNNFYTNRVAQQHLRYAVSMLREHAAEAPEDYASLAARLHLDDAEIATWTRAADAMALPYDDALGIHAQDDTFLDKPRWDFAGTPRSHHPLLMHYHPMTLARHQVCKQADVVLALVLAGDGIGRDCKRRCFDYYEPLTVHDSTLSASTFAVLASEIGYDARAYRYFTDCLRVDLDDRHGNTGHGIHMAAMAGSWLALVWGFAGLRTRHGRLAFDPVLPDGWRGYRFGLLWRGRRVRVDVSSDGTAYTLGAGEALDILHGDLPVRIAPGDAIPLRLPTRRSADAAHAFPRRIDALIFDLDGVLADTARLHHAAWQRLAGELGIAFDNGIGERLKGVDRAGSLEIVLGDRSDEFSPQQKHALAERKNGYYRASIVGLAAHDLLPGAHDALVAARAAGLKIGLASASRSAAEVVERLGIAAYFDHMADASRIARAKPDPEIFASVAAALGVDPGACLGIEDAQAGVLAIKAAGMAALGIGDAGELATADAVLPDLRSFDLHRFVAPPAVRSSTSAHAGFD